MRKQLTKHLMPLKSLIDASKMPSPWRVGNEVLYELCRTRPTHTDEAEVVAKIWLIGRSYAAAIERRKNKSIENDNFYVETVAPAVMGSAIDDWLQKARQCDAPSVETLPTLLQVHHKTTRLFYEISGLEKRSLASKYLHFHVPQVFYIFDSRAVEALRLLSKQVFVAGTPFEQTDNDYRKIEQTDSEYRKFAERCLSLQQLVERQYGVSLSPRELDNVLLQVHERLDNKATNRHAKPTGVLP